VRVRLASSWLHSGGWLPSGVTLHRGLTTPQLHYQPRGDRPLWVHSHCRNRGFNTYHGLVSHHGLTSNCTAQVNYTAEYSLQVHHLLQVTPCIQYIPWVRYPMRVIHPLFTTQRGLTTKWSDSLLRGDQPFWVDYPLQMKPRVWYRLASYCCWQYSTGRVHSRVPTAGWPPAACYTAGSIHAVG